MRTLSNVARGRMQAMPRHVSLGCTSLVARALVRDVSRRITLRDMANDVWLRETAALVGADNEMMAALLASQQPIADVSAVNSIVAVRAGSASRRANSYSRVGSRRGRQASKSACFGGAKDIMQTSHWRSQCNQLSDGALAHAEQRQQRCRRQQDVAAMGRLVCAEGGACAGSGRLDTETADDEPQGVFGLRCAQQELHGGKHH